MENSKEKKNLLNWERKLGTPGMFDLDGLRMGNGERFCSEHLCSSLAVREVKMNYSPDLLCMVVGWWTKLWRSLHLTREIKLQQAQQIRNFYLLQIPRKT